VVHGEATLARETYVFVRAGGGACEPEDGIAASYQPVSDGIEDLLPLGIADSGGSGDA
jgi:hypothetical protein